MVGWRPPSDQSWNFPSYQYFLAFGKLVLTNMAPSFRDVRPRAGRVSGLNRVGDERMIRSPSNLAYRRHNLVGRSDFRLSSRSNGMLSQRGGQVKRTGPPAK